MSNCVKVAPNRMMQLGFLAMAVSVVGQWYLRSHSGLNEDVMDFACGALLGIAIATMLLGVWVQGRSPRK